MNKKDSTWKYFYIEALEDGVYFSFPYDLEYKIDEGDWMLLLSESLSNPITKGSRMSIRGNFPGNINTIKTFNINGLCKIGGDLKSLSYKELAKDILIVNISQFYNLFKGCTTIIEAEKDLLPATQLADYCYYEMFSGCTGLIKAPELPATTLIRNCYTGMFEGCTNLKYIKMLATDISAESCLYDWVRGVSPTGTFVKSKDATWDVVGDSGVPTGWTVITDDQEGGEGGSVMISFTVEDLFEDYPSITYNAEQGMTFGEFCSSKYNVDGWSVEEASYNQGIYRIKHQYGGYITLQGTSVSPEDVINPNIRYMWQS